MRINFEDLHDDLIGQIMTFLSPEDVLCRCACVSQRWKEISQQDWLWQRLVPKALDAEVSEAEVAEHGGWLTYYKESGA
jgi:hypothetical protein